MTEMISTVRCAVHAGRAARDLCPNCDRPRCAEDVERFAGSGCDACVTAVALDRPRTLSQRLISAGLTVIPVAVIGGWIYSQYVEVQTFSWLVPILLGVAGATASTTVWQKGGGWNRPAIAIGVVAALCGTAFGFRLYPHGPHDPLHPWHVVGFPYLCAVAGGLLWPLALGPPRKPKPAAEI